MNKNKVDVIITCYNKEGFIEGAIKSVQSQTLTNFKCCVIDDGSQDNSRQVILNSIKDDERFTYVRLQNCGVANARNAGISYGNAPYITCLDGDDALAPTFLETCYNAIKGETNTGIVFTQLLMKYGDGTTSNGTWGHPKPELQFEGKNQVPCCNMFRRDVFQKTGGYNQRYAIKGAGSEDAELWLRFFKLGYTAKMISEEPLFIYSLNTGITSQKDYKEADWTAWHTNNYLPSLAEPENGIAHIANEYDEPEISTIIPVGKGHALYLRDTLDSLEAQTFLNWEAIVVFDFEPDASFIEWLTTAYPYIKILYTEGFKGAGYARNKGREIAKGDYLIFLDADDFLQPKFMELTLGAIKHLQIPWVYTDLYTQVIYDKENYQRKIIELDNDGLYHEIIKTKGDAIEFVYRYNCDNWDVNSLYIDGIAGVTCLYDARVFDSVGGFDNANNREDWDLHLKLAAAGHCGTRLPLPLYTYRLHTGYRREYKDVAKTESESKKLKLKDIERLHNNYRKEELKMACTNCRKTRINIEPASKNDYTKLVYMGKMQGGTLRGKVTGRAYPINREGQIFTLANVHPQDAQVFIDTRICAPMRIEKKDTKILTSSTPIKIEAKEIVKYDSEPKPEESTADSKQIETKDYEQVAYPDRFTTKQLKDFCSQENMTRASIERMFENETANKNRKSVRRFLSRFLD